MLFLILLVLKLNCKWVMNLGYLSKFFSLKLCSFIQQDQLNECKENNKV